MSKCNIGYPDGVVLLKTLPYRVSDGSEVAQILYSLNKYGDFTGVNSTSNDLLKAAKGYSERLKDPFEAFICAFYEKADGIYLPAEFSSMETVAWMMAENAFAYHKLIFGNIVGTSVSRSAYDEAIRLLRGTWYSGGSSWQNIVKAYWVIGNK